MTSFREAARNGHRQEIQPNIREASCRKRGKNSLQRLVKACNRYGAIYLGLILTLAISSGGHLAVHAADASIKLQSGDLDRTCLLHVPPLYDGKRSLPLVIVIAPSESGKYMVEKTGFSDLGDKYGFIVVYPDANARNQRWNSMFGKVPGGEGVLPDEVDDIAFFRSLVGSLHATHHVDLSRVYVCGLSAGAYMTYRVAVELSDVVAAVGIVCGSMGIKSVDGQPVSTVFPEPIAPVSIFQISGRQDTNVKFEGGQFPKCLAKSTPDCVQFFARANACSTNAVVNVDAEHGFTQTVYSKGRDGTEVQLMVLDRACPKRGSF